MVRGREPTSQGQQDGSARAESAKSTPCNEFFDPNERIRHDLGVFIALLQPARKPLGPTRLITLRLFRMCPVAEFARIRASINPRILANSATMEATRHSRITELAKNEIMRRDLVESASI